MFHGFGGFPGGMPGMGHRSRPVDNSRYYELLGVSKTAPDNEIKKAHRKLALRHHPDKGGDSEKFKEINEAYDVLRDPEKRRVYDEHGEEALKEGAGNGGGGMADIFDLFGGHGHRRRQEPKRQDVAHKLTTTLEDLYNGAVRKMTVKRNLLCDKCSGTGTKSGKRSTCQNCNGSGTELRTQMLGPGMIQQIQKQCSVCSGSGKGIQSGDSCTSCSGSGLMKESRDFEIHIEKGMKNGHKITFQGDAGYYDPSIPPGDLIFIIDIQDHSEFKRHHCDLILTKKISLIQSLCGGVIKINHLDGRTLKITPKEGEVIQPDSWRNVLEEGMPIHGRPSHHGNLYIQFNVEFPKSLTQPHRSELLGILGPLPEPISNEGEETEDKDMEKVDDIENELKSRAKFANNHKTGNLSSDSDSENGFPGGKSVRCAQQ
eukprot:g8455.t1